MTHAHQGHMATALALTAALAVGCSDGTKSKPNTARSGSVPAPVSSGGASGGDVAVGTASVPVPAPATFADGEAAYHAGNFAEASRVFAGYVESRPENAWGHYMLGLSAWKTGDLPRAENAFEQALVIDPNHVKSLVNLGRVRLDQQRPQDAFDTLSRAADIDPESAATHRLLGRALHAQRQTAEAIAAYQRAIELDADDSWSMNNLALLFIEEGRHTEAVPLLTRAIEIRSDVPAFHNNLGMALEHTGQFAAAGAAYTGALTADPNYEKAKRNLARVEGLKDKPQPADSSEAAAIAGDTKPNPSEAPKDEEQKEEPQKDEKPAAEGASC